MNIGKRKRARQDVIYLPVEEILPNPEQPRRQFEPAALEELAVPSAFKKYFVECMDALKCE